jgi:hypothetical protein
MVKAYPKLFACLVNKTGDSSIYNGVRNFTRRALIILAETISSLDH